MKPSEAEVVKRFFGRLEKESPTDEFKVMYRVSGGAPEERYEEEVDMTGAGDASVKVMDTLISREQKRARGTLSPEEVREILSEVQSGLDSLVPAEEARFLPDSMVGSITIELAGKKETFYFLANEDDRVAQKRQVTAPMRKTIDHFEGLSKRFLESKGGR